MEDKYNDIIETKPLFEFLKVGIHNAKGCIKNASASFCPDKECIARYEGRLEAYNHIWKYLEQTFGIGNEEQETLEKEEK